MHLNIAAHGALLSIEEDGVAEVRPGAAVRAAAKDHAQ